MRRLLAFSLFAAQVSLLSAAVDGVVVNRTTGKPAAGVTVNLMRLARGMDMAGSVQTDPQGRFSFPNEQVTQAPVLVQTFLDGVSYNRMIQPGTPSAGLTIDVFSASAKAPDAVVAEHVIFLEPSGSGVSVNEIIAFRNTGNVTYADEKNGTLRFWLPPAAGDQVSVSVNSPQSMTLQRQAEKTEKANVWKVVHAVKPGDTRFNISYTLPTAGAFESKALHNAPVKIVVPRGVSVKGDNVTQIGTEPQTQASIYDVKGSAVKVAIEGAGSLQAAAPAAQQQPSEEEAGGGITSEKPLVYKRLPWVLTLAGTMLILGFAILYRR